MAQYPILRDLEERVWLANCRVSGITLSYRFGVFQKEIEDEFVVLQTEDNLTEFLVRLAPDHVRMETKMITTNNSVEIIP